MTVSLLLFGYVAYRTGALSFTHDESLSFTIAKFGSDWINTANHHPLNTWGMKFFGWLFGEGEFALRLPNLLTFGVYLAACHRIISRAASLTLALFAISALLLNPFLLEHFSLARGYGMSVAFTVASLIFFLQAASTGGSPVNLVGPFIASALFASLALFSNYATLNYVVALFSVFALLGAVRTVKYPDLPRRHLAFLLGVFGLALIPVLEAIRRLLALRGTQQLYFGAETIGQSISSVISSSILLPETQPLSPTIGYTLVSLIAAGLTLILLRRRLESPLFSFALLLAVVLMSLLLQHDILGVRYPLERTGLYLIPLVGVFGYLLAASLHARTPPRWRPVFSAAVTAIIVVPMVYNFVANANLTRSHKWAYDAHTRDVVQRIVESDRYKAHPAPSLRISNHWLFEPTLNYYIVSRGLNIEPADRAGINGEADFIYALASDDPLPGFRELIAYADSETVLYERTDER